MSKLDKLIEELCPDGVEYVTLADVCELITKGTTPKSYATEGIAFIKTESFINDSVDNKKLMYIDENTHTGFLKRSILKENDILFAIAGSIGKCVIVKKDILPANTNQALAIIRLKENINLHYIFHLLKSKSMQSYIEKSVKGSAQPNLNLQQMNNFIIPLPPLPVQQEIVRILDNFTELTAELTAELSLRKKQYEYYKDSLMKFGSEVEWKTLGEIATLVRGNGLPKSDFTENGVGCIHYGQIYTYYGTYTKTTKSFVSAKTAEKLRKVEPNDIIITNTSENVEDVCKAVVWLGDEEIVTGGHATIIKHNENSKYIAYYTQTSMFFNEKKKLAMGTKVIDVSANNLGKIKIPVPPLSEQQRIVDILDRFDALCNDLSSGLPAEIEARRKQYEYYRDKLLSFPVKGEGKKEASL